MNDTSNVIEPAKPKKEAQIPQWLERLVLWGSDRVNPLLVRAIRQNLRSRIFLAVFFLMLGIGGLACVMVATSPNSNSINSQTGLNLFIILTWVWGAGTIIVQSMSAFRSVITERQDDTWDLVELSTLEPRHILRGLLFTALVQGIMFTAALAPFMVMAYMLRGLNIWFLVFSFTLIPALSISTCIFSIFAGCLTGKKGSQAVLGLVALGATLWCYFGCMVFISSSYALSSFIEEFITWDSEALGALFIVFNCWVMFNLMFLIFSASLLKHKAANRSTGPRAIWIAAYLNLIICTLLAPFLFGFNFDRDMLLVPGFIGMFATIILGVFSNSEHYRLTPRQERDIYPDNPLLAFVMVFVGPGAARGRLAFILMSVITVILVGIARIQYGTSNHVHEIFTVVWASLCFTAITLQVSDYLYRNTLRKFFDTPALRRAFTITFFAIINIIPAILIFILKENRIDTDVFEMITPLYSIFNLADNPEDHIILQGGLLIIGVAAYLSMLFDAIRHYHPDTRRVVAQDGDHNPRDH